VNHRSTDAKADERVGTRYGEYLIDALIAEGGMGKVYRATSCDGLRLPQGTCVALKIVKRELADNVTFIRRFKREARIARTILNPHMVPVIDSGDCDGVPYIVSRFIPGSSLEKLLRREGRLDVATTVRICAHAADGLDALWAAGLVHRDVKPSNVVLDEDGNAYLTDFGLAKDTHGSTLLTGTGQTLGTLAYMSPEQIRAEPVEAAADVYSLGCVMFECVHGLTPFGNRQGLRLLWAHLQDHPPEPCPDRRDVPDEFRAALLTALEKDPSRRPPSSTAYAQLLAQAAGIPFESLVA
jgi:serine/threonine-protein kinase